MRTLVCGGRDYEDRIAMHRTLNICKEFCFRQGRILVIIQGGATGADALALDWALLNKVPWFNEPADWAKHDKNAGSIRNQEMIIKYNPNIVLAFPGGFGTADMIARAHAARIPVFLAEILTIRQLMELKL